MCKFFTLHYEGAANICSFHVLIFSNDVLSLPRPMKLRFSMPAKLVLLLIAVLFLPSCDDKDLVRNNEELSERIAQIKKELKQLEAGVESGVDVEAADIKRSDMALKKTLENLQDLKDEKLRLDEKHIELKRELQKRNEEYRREFPNAK